ncbi:MAG: carboxyl-terminal processing protease [Frankiales bacterium]|jgi:carboxyl-terminal processing protease|nr:carboxyl-terminal processing protease [Frankiales bacterium]
MPSPRPYFRVAALIGAIGVSYLAGVVTGVVGTQDTGDTHGTSVLDEAADRISREAATPVSREELDKAAVQGMLTALGDRYSAYYDPKQYASFQDVLDGRYTGVGLWVRRGSNGEATVTSVQTGSPAAKAGVRAGDELLSVDGKPVSEHTIAEVVAALRGKSGTRVAIDLRQDGRTLHLVLRRAAVVNGDVDVDDLAPDIVRIRVMAFTHGTGRQVRSAMTTARNRHVAGVVLDLRDNPGGLLDEAVETASGLLNGGPVVTFVRRGEAPRTLTATGDGDTTTPVVILVNGGTASAAEVVAAALQDRGRAVLVGGRTFGKGTVQEPSKLLNGSALELTVGHYVTPAGKSLDGVGIEPDIEVTAGARNGVAESRALQVLHGLLADSGATGRG